MTLRDDEPIDLSHERQLLAVEHLTRIITAQLMVSGFPVPVDVVRACAANVVMGIFGLGLPEKVQPPTEEPPPRMAFPPLPRAAAEAIMDYQRRNAALEREIHRLHGVLAEFNRMVGEGKIIISPEFQAQALQQMEDQHDGSDQGR